MEEITIIGNGFDLRHNLNTGYGHFIDYYTENFPDNNVIIRFYKEMNRCQGWYDFEHDLLLFFEMLTELRESMQLTEYRNYYKIDIFKFVRSPESQIFYRVIQSMGYPFLQGNKGDSILIELENSTWHKSLVDEVLSGYHDICNQLAKYLKGEVDDRISDIKLLDTPEIDVIKKSKAVYTFNYTGLLDAYGINDVSYVHGSLKGYIILGIPYSNRMRIKDFQNIFKISQSIRLGKNTKLIRSFNEKITINMIGFSFGLSDHYFFQEIKDWINNFYRGQGETNKYIVFRFFYHSESSRLDFLNNLRLFLGEEMLTRFDIADQILFMKLQEVVDNVT